jgi:hypothetical protein
MIIESDETFDPLPQVPIVLRVHRVSNMAEAMLDTEVVQRQADGTARIKTYDASGAVVLIILPQSLAEEIVFGDIANVTGT